MLLRCPPEAAEETSKAFFLCLLGCVLAYTSLCVLKTLLSEGRGSLGEMILGIVHERVGKVREPAFLASNDRDKV